MKMSAKMSERFPGVTGIGEFKYLKRLTAAYLRGVEDGRATAPSQADRIADCIAMLKRVRMRKYRKTVKKGDACDG